MKIEDGFTVAAPIERVWACITDPDIVAPCVPGCQSVEAISPTAYKAQVQIAVGPIKAKFNLDVEVIEENPPNELRSRTRGEEGSRASIVSAENLLRLAPAEDGGTEVTYSSEVSVVGRLGKFGLGVMKKKAQTLGQQFAENFRQKVEEEATGAAEAAVQAAKAER